MVFPAYTNFVAPAIDAGNLNEVNNVIYNILGTGGNAPLSGLEVRNNIGTTAAIAAGDAATLASANAFATAADAALTGRLLNVVRLTGSGNYTPTAGTTSIIAHIIGGGGAGGGSAATAGGQLSCGAGGSSGGLVIHRATSGFSGQPYVVGTGGVGVSGGVGGVGVASTFLGCTANGGGAGGALPATAAADTRAGGIGGTATGGSILNSQGNPGQMCVIFAAAAALLAGAGGGSYFGGGAGSPGVLTAPGNTATCLGSGGSGASTLAAAGAQVGGSGAPGTIVIYEYN